MSYDHLTLSTYGLRLLFSNIVGHPLEYVKFLIQIGHEPLPPYPTTNFLGKSIMRLPNCIYYLEHIKKKDGWIGLYRGCLPKIMGHIAGSGATVTTTDYYLQLPDPSYLMVDRNLSHQQRSHYLIATLKKNIIERVVFVTVSHPFIVVSSRMMASFVGGEIAYRGIFSTIREVIQEDGIRGFFSGYLPRVIGDVAAGIAFTLAIFGINNYLIGDKGLQNMTATFIGYYINSKVHPFAVVSSCMTVNNINLQAGKPPNMVYFSSWKSCWDHLSLNNQLNRGSALFFRPFAGDPAGTIQVAHK